MYSIVAMHHMQLPSLTRFIVTRLLSALRYAHEWLFGVSQRAAYCAPARTERLARASAVGQDNSRLSKLAFDITTVLEKATLHTH